MCNPRFRTRSERPRGAWLAGWAIALSGCAVLCLGACDSFTPREAPPPCDPVNDPSCRPPPDFLAPINPLIVRDNIERAIEGRTVEPNYKRSLAPEPEDLPDAFVYFPDPQAEALAPFPGYFVGWDKVREVQFMLTLLEASGDSLRNVEMAFPRFSVDPDFPSTSTLTRYDVDYELTLTYVRGDPPQERIDFYAGRSKWDFFTGDRDLFWTLLRWEDIGLPPSSSSTPIGTMGSLRTFVRP